ncbi:MAG: permease [Candidatus Riflebacteria bacterium]|nr:permease [Candidatus Riflebacteria bacterium]
MEALQLLIQSILSWFEPLRGTWLWPGLAETGKFLGTHLLSGMVPAFFIAGAISIFLDKQRITKLMGANANPIVAYPVAALSGGILTVCSCGVIPIFTSIMQQGAGIGPAFTFLMSSPAVNLIALTYTYSLLGTHFLWGRVLAVLVSSIFIGVSMRLFFGKGKIEEPPQGIIIVEDDDHSDSEILMFFVLLILFMITATGTIDFLITPIMNKLAITGALMPRIAALGVIFIAVVLFCKKYFSKGEIKLWLKKTYSLFAMIFPKVLGGIFVCGCLAALINLTDYMAYFDNNNHESNLLSAVLGSLMYFGTIVGVTIVSTLHDFGMHGGPSMTLLLAGPAISLPSVLALTPIVGVKKALIFLLMVILFSAISGFVFGLTF